MTVPTLSGLLPGFGRNGGQTMIMVEGSGFRVPVAPAADAPLPIPTPKPTVAVTFDGLPGTRVEVRSDSVLYVLTPRHPQGVVDVSVQNLDDDGQPIAGELATLPASFEYRYPKFTSEDESIYLRVVRALCLLIKNDVCNNLTLGGGSVDFDSNPDDLLNYIDVSEFPAIAVLGPVDTPLNRQLRPPTRTYEQIAAPTSDSPGEFARRRVTRAYDLIWDIVGVIDTTHGALALQTAITEWFGRNGYFQVQRDTSDPSKGSATFECDLVGGMALFGVPNKEDIRGCRGRFVIYAVDIGDLHGFPGDNIDKRGGYLKTATVGAGQLPDPDPDEEE